MMCDLNKNSIIEDLSQVGPSDQGIQRRSWEGGIVTGFLELGEGWVECEEKEAEVNGFPSLIANIDFVDQEGAIDVLRKNVAHHRKSLVGQQWVIVLECCKHNYLLLKTEMCVCVCALSRVWLFVTPQTVVCQAPLFTEFSWHKY